VDELFAHFDRLEGVLPPRGYFERLADFGRQGRRTFRCRIPLTHVQTFDDGVVASCSNCWASSLGNLSDEESVFDQVGKATIHRLFLKDPPRFPFCRGCFTPFDVVNVYLDGDCELEDLTAMDLFSSRVVQNRLLELRESILEGAALRT
jgi:hypothetical protein